MEHYLPTNILHWNYRGFTEFPIEKLKGDEKEVTDIYLKENLISRVPKDIGNLVHLESLYLSGNDITDLPNEISRLKFLKCLDVSGNRLRRIPEEIGDVRSLKFLILDENELCELPLRIAELRLLRYLSVCDNKLRWLPQRPVYNYHHCELRFWRNSSLKTIPYSLWYHMFREQQTRSLHIGCLTIPECHHISPNGQCRLKITQGSREYEFDVECPTQHQTILHSCKPALPASLFELCRRAFYQILSDTAKNMSEGNYSIYSDYNRKMCNLEDHFEDININNENTDNRDLNGNSIMNIFPKDLYINSITKSRKKDYYTPSDLIEEHFNLLPIFIKDDFRCGPVSRCEFNNCKKPVFDYAYYEFCVGKIVLIDNTEDIVLSTVFCSKSCANSWKKSKRVLTWELTKSPPLP